MRSNESPVMEMGLDDPTTEDLFGPSVGEFPESEVSERDLENVNKTGTTTIGITTNDGVVLATDQRASLAGRFVSHKNVQKVEQIHPHGAMTMAGSVGGAQAFLRSIRAETNLYEVRRGDEMSMTALSTLAGNFLRGGPFFLVSPILGGVDDEGHHVYSLDPAGGVLPDDYVATGSGMQLAYGTLEQEYTDDLTTEEAISVAAHGIQSATERDTGSGNGIFVATVDESGVDIRGHEDFEAVL